MSSGHSFHRSKRRRPDRAQQGSPSDEDLQSRLTSRVTQRFQRITGLTVVSIPLDVPGADQENEPLPLPLHPLCADFSDSRICRQAWRAHLSELDRHPELHWHRCAHGRYCAIVPLVWARRCLAVCKLVCPDTMAEDEFEKWVELLDVLIENFVASEAELLSKLLPAECDLDASEPIPVEGRRPVDESGEINPLVASALAHIRRHLTDPSMTVASIARDLGVSAAYLAHLFSMEVGMRMSRYIAARRVDLAKNLLATTNWQIKQVAFESGHSNPYWFSEVFRAHTGLTPSKFRRTSRPASA